MNRIPFRDRVSIRPRHVLPPLLIIFLLITTTGAYMGALEWDEGSFLLNAEYFHGTGENIEESRPHALSYAVNLLWYVTGESTFAARLLVSVFGVACILLLYRIAREEFDNPLPVTVAFAATPLLLYWSFHVYTDVPALFFVLGSYYLFRRERHLFAGILMAVAVTVRYVFAVFAIGMAIGYVIQHRDAILSYAGGGVLGSLPFFTYSYLDYGGVFARVQMYVTRVSEWSDSHLFAATADSATAAATMLSTLIPAAATGWRKSPVVEKSMIIVYAAFFLFVSGMSFGRYWLAVTPFLLLMAYRGLGDRQPLFAFAVIGMILISGVSVGTTFTDIQTCSEPLYSALDHVEQREGAVVSDQWAITGYLLDRAVHSPWTDYERLRDEYGVRYAVTAEQLPYEQDAQFSNVCQTYYVYDLADASE